MYSTDFASNGQSDSLVTQSMNPSLSTWYQTGGFIRWRGHKIFLARGGSGPAVLLIHGYPTGSYDWHLLWQALTARFTVFAPDMLGLGFSDKPRNHQYGIDVHVDLHEEVLERFGVQRVSLIAHDLGVTVAQEMLARRMEATRLTEIESVVLLNGGMCPEAYHPRLIQKLLSSSLGPLIGPRIPRRAFDRSIQRLFSPQQPVSQDMLDCFWELANYNNGLSVTHAVGRFYIERMNRRNRLVSTLLKPIAPILAINGAADPNSGKAMIERYLHLKPDADVVSFNDVGHWPQIEAPELVLNNLQRVLKW